MFFSCTKNIEVLKQKLNNCFDVIDKSFTVANKGLAILYIKSLVNNDLLPLALLNPIYNAKSIENTKMLKDDVIRLADMTLETEEKKVLDGVLDGKVALFLEGDSTCLLVDIKNVPARSPAEPPTSAVIYGPRMGFTENVAINIAMLRKRLPSPSFVVQNFMVGRHTKTKILVCHLDGIASKQTVKEICKKIESINIDGVIDSSYILAYFQGKNTIFKRAGLAEKPDIVTAKLLEGRVAILVDGSPIALTLPFMVFEDLQNSNDYYTNAVYSSFLRVLRLLGLFIAVVLPGLYLSLRLYHFKVLPLRFLITISNTTEGLPFTPFMEILFILILFQILYEVSLRLPQYLGLATSIVGALILGQTGVSAGLISPPGVIIIAMSIIAVYTIADQIAQVTLLRALFLIVGGTVGILGIVGCTLYFVHYLASLNQYGTSYLAPYAPRKKADLKDGLLLNPLPKMKRRPESIRTNNKTRQSKKKVKK
ncbi:MAG: spore germination protein [Clostridia bacterium]|nr:spore germination protein [Clostridia bacterium]